jgi:signal transduction histidine kinase
VERTPDPPAGASGPVTTRERRQDLVVAACFLVAGVASLVMSTSMGVLAVEGAAPLPEQVLWVAVVVLPLAVRRRIPVVVAVVVATAFIAAQVRGTGEGIVVSVALYAALYTVGARVPDRRLATAVRALVVVAMFAWLFIALFRTAWGEAVQPGPVEQVGPLPPMTASVLYSVVFNAVYFAAAWAFGNAAWRADRQRVELARALSDLEASREENARRAVQDERVRIARELHDVVAHHVSVMGVQAGAARRVLDTDPVGGLDAARGAIRAVEGSSRTAVGEMRRLLGVLRSADDGGPAAPGVGGGAEGGPTPPAPDLSGLPGLVASVASTSALDAAFEAVGERREVPPSTQVSVYRVVQEALTNVVKHAAARTVRVRLRYLPEELEVEVLDDGRGAREGRGVRADGSGMGLRGMAERVALHEGALDVGARPGGGFRVRARFPLEGAR